jgi:hypothetical protein
MTTHCRIGRITPTEAGLRCPKFMAFLFERPLKASPDWITQRFMRIEGPSGASSPLPRTRSFTSPPSAAVVSGC